MVRDYVTGRGNNEKCNCTFEASSDAGWWSENEDRSGGNIEFKMCCSTSRRINNPSVKTDPKSR